MSNPKVTMVVENKGTIELELYPESAPQSVSNFVELAEKGYYNGLTFHRIIPNFMIQGGCPDGTGMGGPGHHIKGEFKRNGVANALKHTRGTLSMARAQAPNSAGSQFFICHVDTPHLDDNYAAFGRVISGIEVLDAIASVQTDGRDKPITPVVITTVTVDRQGAELEAVERY